MILFIQCKKDVVHNNNNAYFYLFTFIQELHVFKMCNNEVKYSDYHCIMHAEANDCFLYTLVSCRSRVI